MNGTGAPGPHRPIGPKGEALRRFLDQETGHGWEYCHEAPAQRAILQAFGRMIRSENDRGIAIVVDRRAPTFEGVLPGLAPLGDLRATAKQFYAKRARWLPLPGGAPGATSPAPSSSPKA